MKKVEVYFCELCRRYLPRRDQPEKALSFHCRTRYHLQRYVRHRDDKALRREAERIHRKEVQEKEEKEQKKKEKQEGEKVKSAVWFKILPIDGRSSFFQFLLFDQHFGETLPPCV